jgi:protein SCO1/2
VRRLARAAAALLGVFLVAGASAEDAVLKEIGYDQKLGARLSRDLRFRDAEGQEIYLGTLFQKRPAVLALVYYECPMLCTLILNGLVRSLKAVPLVPGRDFDVVAVSINPAETPELAAAKKEIVLRQYGKWESGEGWHFLTGDEPSIRALADAVGFRYKYDPATRQYAHASGILVVAPGGKVSRYFLGVEYAPRDLRLALVESGFGRVGTFADQVMLFCYQYDPAHGRYTLAVMNLVRAAGLLTLLVLGGAVARMALAERRKRRKG